MFNSYSQSIQPQSGLADQNNCVSELCRMVLVLTDREWCQYSIGSEVEGEEEVEVEGGGVAATLI